MQAIRPASHRLPSVPEVMRASYFSYRVPFARGVDMTHQITDLLGIAMGGGEGNRVMGFGFPDQAIVWDGSAVENTYRYLIQTQHAPPHAHRRPGPPDPPCRATPATCAVSGDSPMAMRRQTNFEFINRSIILAKVGECTGAHPTQHCRLTC